MKITAVAVGTRGDVNPLVGLGSEMVKRGHEFRILAQEEFRPLIENQVKLSQRNWQSYRSGWLRH